MSLSALEKEFIDACCTVPPDFERAKALLVAGADINSKADYNEPLVSKIILGYPSESMRCIQCETETCEGCPQNDVTYLPRIVEFLIENGWNTKETGARVLSSLVFSTYSKDMFDAAKLICQAGIDWSQSLAEDTLSTIGTEESYQRCEGDHSLENLFYTYYEVVEHARQHQPFAHIDTYHAAIGLTIDSVIVFGADTGVCTDDLGRTTYAHDIGLVCGDKTVIIKKDVNVLLMNGQQNMLPCVVADDIFGAPVCGRTITKISFSHNTVIKGPVHYGQPVINLHLDDGVIISFTHNYGELPKGECVSRFSIA